METFKTIGEQLRESRDQAGLTQQGLAEKSGISKFTIAALEQSKKKDCSTYIIRKIQKALNIKFEI